MPMPWGGSRDSEKHEAARFRGFWALLSVWESCYENSSGCVVDVVGEPVSNAA